MARVISSDRVGSTGLQAAGKIEILKDFYKQVFKYSEALMVHSYTDRFDKDAQLRFFSDLNKVLRNMCKEFCRNEWA